MSNNEELCKSKFDQFLRRLSVPNAIAWRRVPEKEECPDYYLSLNGTEYAVEVTILMEELAVGKDTLPKAGVISYLRQLVHEVELIAGQKNYLHGTYVVRFLRPIHGLRSVKDRIQTGLLDYIQSTQGSSNAPEKTVFRRGKQICAIRKFHDKPNKVIPGGPFLGKWEDQAAIEICGLLEERIYVKRNLLRTFGHPKILLLYDAYLFATPRMYRDCTDELSSLGAFHTVFVIQSGTDGFVLYSENCAWL